MDKVVARTAALAARPSPPARADRRLTGGRAVSRADQLLPARVPEGRSLLGHLQLLRRTLVRTGTRPPPLQIGNLVHLDKTTTVRRHEIVRGIYAA